MASWKSHHYLGGTDMTNTSAFTDQSEFDESEIWNTYDNLNPPETKKLVSDDPSQLQKPIRKNVNDDRLPDGPKSLPINIPDWSKILRGEYKRRIEDFSDDYKYESEEGDGNDILPPHVYLARTRVASLSVLEGRGRTLKGRDLTTVRNAIWKIIGFEG